MADINVVDTAITGVLISGEWLNVHTVVITWAEFTRTTPTTTHTWAVGLYLAATVSGGPHSGRRIVAPLRSIDAFRVNP